METIVLGAGCFWCTEAVFLRVRGVSSVTPGYAGGTVPDPSYEQVCSGMTGHAEVVKAEYDRSVVSLQSLLDIFFMIHDPTSLNRQGKDIGSQYRSVILWTTEEQQACIEHAVRNQEKRYDAPVVTEIRRLDIFYPAESYHRRYFERHPDAAYCAVVIRPKVVAVARKSPDVIVA